MKMKIVISVVFCLPVLLGALTASAQIYENYPGVSCEYYGTQASDTYFQPNGYKAVGLKNISASSRYVTCPIKRDLDLTDISVFMFIYEPLSGPASNCYIYSVDLQGTMQTGEWQKYSLDSADDMGNGVTMYYNSQPKGFGHASSLYCSIPPQAVINGYSVASY